MDWALDDILMGEFQIPPSPSMQISEESMPNSCDTKNDETYPGNSGSNPSHIIQENDSTNLPETTSSSNSSAGQMNSENDERDYVSELHQLLSEEDDSHLENGRFNYDDASHFSSNNHSGNILQDDSHKEACTDDKIEKETEVEAVTGIANRSLSVETTTLPLLLSPPPAYKDEVGDLSFIISKNNGMESLSSSKANFINKNIHSEISKYNISLSKQPILIPPHNLNKTIAVGDTYLTISPASVATTPLTSKTAFSTGITKKDAQPLPFSMTRLPGGTILHSTTIKPAKSSSNSFSFLPITPLTTASTISTKTSTTHSPLLLKALTPPRTLESSFTSFPLSITPISAPFSTDLVGEGGSQTKRFRSQSTLSFTHEPIWKKDDDLKDVISNKFNENQVLSAPASVETLSSNMHQNSQPMSNLSLPVHTIGHNINSSNDTSSFDTESSKSLISLPPTLLSTNSNQQLSNELRALKNDDFMVEKDQSYEAASKLAESLAALQNSAIPQAGESSVDLMNALSLSILPIPEDINRHQTSAFRPVDPNALIRQDISCGPLVSSDLSLSSNKFMGNSNSEAILSSNSTSSNRPLSILSGNNIDGSTISIRPIWKESEILSSDKSSSRTAWDSAVVAQLGTLTPCAPPPIASLGASKSSISNTFPVGVLPPPSKPLVAPPMSVGNFDPSQTSESLTSNVLPIKHESISIQNELGSISASRPQSGLSSILLPPPPYPSSPFSSYSVASKSSFPANPQTPRAAAAMSEADSGVESIDSLSPKDVSPISSPATSAGSQSELLLSNSVIHPPPVSFCSSNNNNSCIRTSNLTAFKPSINVGLDDKEKKPAHQVYSDKVLKSLLDTNVSNLDKSISQCSMENTYGRNLKSGNASATSKSVLSTLLSTVPKPTKSSELLSTLLNSQVTAPATVSVPPFSVSIRTNDFVSCLTSPSNMSLPQNTNLNLITNKPPLKRSSSVIAINPNDMILSKDEKNKAKMRDFGRESSCSDVFNELDEHMKIGVFSNENVDESSASLVDEPILRSALEDMDTSICQRQQKTDFNSTQNSLIYKKKDLDMAIHPMSVINNNKTDPYKSLASGTQGPTLPSKQGKCPNVIFFESFLQPYKMQLKQ